MDDEGQAPAQEESRYGRKSIFDRVHTLYDGQYSCLRLGYVRDRFSVKAFLESAPILESRRGKPPERGVPSYDYDNSNFAFLRADNLCVLIEAIRRFEAGEFQEALVFLNDRTCISVSNLHPDGKDGDYVSIHVLRKNGDDDEFAGFPLVSEAARRTVGFNAEASEGGESVEENVEAEINVDFEVFKAFLKSAMHCVLDATFSATEMSSVGSGRRTGGGQASRASIRRNFSRPGGDREKDDKPSPPKEIKEQPPSDMKNLLDKFAE